MICELVFTSFQSISKQLGDPKHIRAIQRSFSTSHAARLTQQIAFRICQIISRHFNTLQFEASQSKSEFIQSHSEKVALSETLRLFRSIWKYCKPFQYSSERIEQVRFSEYHSTSTVQSMSQKQKPLDNISGIFRSHLASPICQALWSKSSSGYRRSYKNIVQFAKCVRADQSQFI